MTLNMPLDFDQPPFFNDSTNDEENFLDNQDYLATMNRAWLNIDPALVNLSFQGSSQQTPSMPSRIQQHSHNQRIQQPPMQRYMHTQELQLFTVDSAPNNIPYRLHNPSAPISSLPQASHARVESPSPSQGLTSSCGSAPSPATEPENFPDPRYAQAYPAAYRAGMDAYYGRSLGEPEGGPGHYQSYSLPQGSFYVNPSDVQAFADEQFKFEHDEGFDDIPMKTEYGMEVDQHHHNMKISGDSHSYRYPSASDEGLGASIQDSPSPKNTILVDDGATSDLDAEGDIDVDAEPPATPTSDTEYTPKATRSTRKPRRASKPTSPPSMKRNRITKSIPKTKGSAVCKSCDHAPFKDAAALQRHVASAHTRAFVCVFDFAGCKSTFASKNEWKRHVSSQHLNLAAWVCQLGSCGKVGSRHPNTNGVMIQGSEFNRKDLFTQHLRRMHVPMAVKKKKAVDQGWEDQIKALQTSCLTVKRQAPTKLRCPLQGCGHLFEGNNCWDDRMEHVAKHLEAVAVKGGVALSQGDDDLLVNWALREDIIEYSPVPGGFRLVVGGSGAPRVSGPDEDQDAEGEDEAVSS